MAKNSIVFTLKGVAQTFDPSGLETKEIKSPFDWLPFKKKGEKKYEPGKLLLTVRVLPKKIFHDGIGEVSGLIIQLNRENEDDSDVLCEGLMNNKNLDKEFAISDLNTAHEGVKYYDNFLAISRDAFHNIIPPQILIDLNKKPWKAPTEQEIKDASDDEFNKMAREFKEETTENYIVKEFENLINCINSGGIYYEVHDSFGYNAYYNRTGYDATDPDQSKWVDPKAKRGTETDKITVPWEIGSTEAIAAAKTPDSLKDNLIDYIKEYNEIIKAKEKEIKKMKKLISNWRKEGNLTDAEHNEEVKRWKGTTVDSGINKKYDDLAAKIARGEAKYKDFTSEFNKESSKETEPGVAANKDLASLGTPESITEDFYTATSSIKDKKLAKKKAFREMRKLRDKILDRKKAVVELIEAKVGPNGPNGPNQNIPQLISEATTAIQTELNKSPTVADSELGSHANWRTAISNLTTETDITNFKTTLISAIEAARTKKQSGDKLKRLIANGKTKNNYEELETISKEIQKEFSETPAYRTEKTEIDSLEKKLQDLDPTGKKYAKTVQSYIEAKLNVVGLKEQDLTDENQKDFKDLKENKISDKTKLSQIRSKVFEDIGKTDATKKIEALQSKVQAALDSKKQSEIEAAKVDVNNFISKIANNVYYKEKETVAKALLTRLENPNQQNGDLSNNSDGLPWKIIVPVALLSIVVVGIAIVMVWRNKKQAEEE